MIRKLLLYFFLLSVIISCSSPKGDVADQFMPVINWDLPGDKRFEIDMDSVITNGIEAPTFNQVEEGSFLFSFRYHKPEADEKYYYKIYYQNEDYKFPEHKAGEKDIFINENFYGSWGPEEYGFKEIPAGQEIITDRFKITGNPRNEPQYFGIPMQNYQVDEPAIVAMINTIKANADWFKMVDEKALNNKRSLEVQLRLDAIFTIGLNRNKGDENHRWKRNPRMGKYSAMLVVCSESDLKLIPDYIQNITLMHKDEYQNPFHYFLHGKGKKLSGTTVLTDPEFINLYSKLDLSKGIFINLADQQNPLRFDSLRADCNKTTEMFRSAHVQQFFHGENKDYELKTIPVIADILNDEYTVEDYLHAEKTYSGSEMVSDYIRNSECPCSTVSAKDDHIEIFNPQSKDLETARKENVGIKTRVGYTYGKFTAKIKFPSQLNSTNVWTGITNAFWMIYQDNAEWNNRRPSISGYTPKGSYSKDAPRIPVTPYSEIDFEIVKTSQYWPVGYPDGIPKTEDPRQNSDVIVTATNFDLCNEDPQKYSSGFSPVVYNNTEYLPFRWMPWYQALSVRTPVKNDELYGGPYYYYQIEWKPDEIIWRIGPAKDKMRVIAYMNDKITSVPNNQMLMIVTQEYHQSDWWPPVVFKQDFIPFLKNNIYGKIYSFEIE